MRGVRISGRVPLERLLVEAILRIAAAKIATADSPCEMPALFLALAPRSRLRRDRDKCRRAWHLRLRSESQLPNQSVVKGAVADIFGEVPKHIDHGPFFARLQRRKRIVRLGFIWLGQLFRSGTMTAGKRESVIVV